MENHKYQYSKAYFKILNLIQSNPDEDVFVICGGQGAGKTISILELIIQALLVSQKEATVLSSELSKMKKTVVRDYVKICKDWGIIQNVTDFNKSENKHEYPNDSYIDFLGADTSDVGKGFRRDLLYINEADKITIEQAVQFISRAGLTLIDYNPDRHFWGDEYVNANNFIILTFEDNEYLPEQERKSILDYKVRGFYNPNLDLDELFKDENIKSTYWANKWRVYGLGLVGSLEGQIFTNYEKIKQIPTDARLLGYGLDFGFSSSSTAVVEVYKWDNKYILNEVIYKTGLTNQAIATELKNKGYKGGLVYCDSAEPKSIHELQISGINAHQCDSKQDIKDYAIQELQKDVFYITDSSKNIIFEFKNLVWGFDSKGIPLGKPQKTKHDHSCDAVFYFIGTINKYDGKYR
jgi:phage terminase large subunit